MGVTVETKVSVGCTSDLPRTRAFGAGPSWAEERAEAAAANLHLPYLPLHLPYLPLATPRRQSAALKQGRWLPSGSRGWMGRWMDRSRPSPLAQGKSALTLRQGKMRVARAREWRHRPSCSAPWCSDPCLDGTFWAQAPSSFLDETILAPPLMRKRPARLAERRSSS